MKFTAAPLQGAFIVEMERMSDERGFFARTWCAQEFQKAGLNSGLVQCSTSWNRAKGTLRGMHFQKTPYEETKLVRCTMGAVFDVMVDLRPTSPTYRKWFGAELTAENRLALYIPKGFAHGFLTLEDNSELFYQMAEYWHPDAAGGMRWDDPNVGIKWPFKPTVISARDASYPDLATNS